ncbi:MAG: family 16 glycosylhydrolase [Pseudomonadota bacterium]
MSYSRCSSPGVVHATMHTGAFNHTRGNARSAQTTLPDTCNEFHRYQLTWNAARITDGVDDHNFYQYPTRPVLGRRTPPGDALLRVKNR